MQVVGQARLVGHFNGVPVKELPGALHNFYARRRECPFNISGLLLGQLKDSGVEPFHVHLQNGGFSFGVFNA